MLYSAFPLTCDPVIAWHSERSERVGNFHHKAWRYILVGYVLSNLYGPEEPGNLFMFSCTVCCFVVVLSLFFVFLFCCWFLLGQTSGGATHQLRHFLISSSIEVSR